MSATSDLRLIISGNATGAIAALGGLEVAMSKGTLAAGVMESALAVGLAAALVKVGSASVEAAAKFQVSQSLLQNQLSLSGEAWSTSGDAVMKNVQAMSSWSGYTETQVMDQMRKLERITGDSTKAFGMETAAIEVARNMHWDLGRSVDITNKAYLGLVGRLRMAGINLPAGSKGMQAVNELMKQVAGSTDVWSQSLEGVDARLAALVNTTEVSIGQVFLPLITAAKEALVTLLEAWNSQPQWIQTGEVIGAAVLGVGFVINTVITKTLPMMAGLMAALKGVGVAALDGAKDVVVAEATKSAAVEASTAAITAAEGAQGIAYTSIGGGMVAMEGGALGNAVIPSSMVGASAATMRTAGNAGGARILEAQAAQVAADAAAAAGAETGLVAGEAAASEVAGTVSASAAAEAAAAAAAASGTAAPLVATGFIASLGGVLATIAPALLMAAAVAWGAVAASLAEKFVQAMDEVAPRIKAAIINIFEHPEVIAEAAEKAGAYLGDAFAFGFKTIGSTPAKREELWAAFLLGGPVGLAFESNAQVRGADAASLAAQHAAGIYGPLSPQVTTQIATEQQTQRDAQLKSWAADLALRDAQRAVAKQETAEQDAIIAARKNEQEQELQATQAYRKQESQAAQNYQKQKDSMVRALAKSERDAWKTYNQSLKDEADSIANSASLFDRVVDKPNVAAETLVRNMESQAERLTRWQGYIEQLRKRGLSKEQMAQLVQLGPENISNVSALASASTADLAAWKKYYADRAKVGTAEAATAKTKDKQAVIDNIAEMRATEKDNLAELTTSYKDSLAELTTSYKASMAKLKKDLAKTEQSIVSSLDPFAGEKGQLALAQAQDNYGKASEALAMAIGQTQADVDAAGKSIPEGLRQGIVNGTLPIADAVDQMAQMGVLKPLITAFDTHSPSKVTYAIGADVGQGLLLGITDQLKVLTPFSIGASISEGLASGILGGISSAVGAAGSLISSVMSKLSTGFSGGGGAGGGGGGGGAGGGAGGSTYTGGVELGGSTQTPTRISVSGKFTSAQWAKAFLQSTGLPVTAANLRNVETWERYESGSNVGRWNNPLNTTQNAIGAISMNSVGVKRYMSEAAGLAATIKTLNNGRYGSIISALRAGDFTVRQFEHAVGSTPWGTFHGYERGGMARGPASGYPVMLHGYEGVFNSEQLKALSIGLSGHNRPTVNGPLIGNVTISNDYDVRKLMVALQAEFDTELAAQGRQS